MTFLLKGNLLGSARLGKYVKLDSTNILNNAVELVSAIMLENNLKCSEDLIRSIEYEKEEKLFSLGICNRCEKNAN